MDIGYKNFPTITNTAAGVITQHPPHIFLVSYVVLCVPMPHSTVKRILMQDAYIGTDYYPAIISPETFVKANGRRLHRANLHGSEKRYTAPPIHKVFELAAAETHFDDPAEQAEYIYSLIESR